MPIGTSSQIANAILSFSDPDNENFPGTSAEVAQKWADVADILLAAVIPASSTAAAGKAAFIGILSAVNSNTPNGLTLLDNAFVAYAASLAGGMSPLYTGTPPPSPPGLPALLSSPSTDAAAVANSIGTLLSAWAKTGIATLVAPPFTQSPWS